MVKDLIIRKPCAVQIGMMLVMAIGALVVVPGIHALQRARQTPANPVDENLQRKLAQRVRFTPAAKDPLEQVLEVARAFQVPMGIEWLEPSQCRPMPKLPNELSVKELLNLIVSRCPVQRLIVENGIVHVYSALTSSVQNILNFRIRNFQVKNENLFIAQHELRRAIDMQLHPEAYSDGYNGGTGFPPHDVFAVPNVSFSARNITLRKVLDGITKANGNALWLARLNKASLRLSTPLARRYKDREAVIGIWQFIPLNENAATR